MGLAGLEKSRPCVSTYGPGCCRPPPFFNSLSVLISLCQLLAINNGFINVGFLAIKTFFVGGLFYCANFLNFGSLCLKRGKINFDGWTFLPVEQVTCFYLAQNM